MELEARVEELETLLKAANRESNMAASLMNKMENELLYYRSRLSVTAIPPNDFAASYLNSQRQLDVAAGQHQQGEKNIMSAFIPACSLASSIPTSITPGISSDPSATTARGQNHLQWSRLMGDSRMSPGEQVDKSMRAYFQFNNVSHLEN